MDETLIVIPAWNEARNLPPLLKRIREFCPEAPILVVDDGSADETARVSGQAPGVLVLRHPFNLGYGTALQSGARYALARGFGRAVFIDGDGQHDPASIPGLLAPLARDGADLVVGSRFLDPRSYTPPFFRRLAMKGFALLTRLITGLRITDPTSGFLALSRPALLRIASPDFPVEYPDANNIIWLHRLGLRIGEVPVLMHKNPGRRSMHSGFRAVYYFLFMFLSILVILLRKK